MSNHLNRELPIPEHYNPSRVGEVWRVPYQERASQARAWSKHHNIQQSSSDKFRTALIAIDIQNTFCIPDFELFVAGQSGKAAVEDNRRLCEFIYRNLGNLTQVTATLDTHKAMQIFHPIFLVNDQGEHPKPMTLISHEDITSGLWRFNTAIADSLGIDADFGQKHLLHYTQELRAREKYDLTVWPYHAMLGSIGHALVSSVEEAFFFHTIARNSKVDFDVKGDNPLTEHYSALGPEVTEGPNGRTLAQKNKKFLDQLEHFNILIIAGQAKSHCVAWTIEDLLEDIIEFDRNLVEKIYLLEDCTSPVVVPGVIDYTDQADAAFERFESAGMHVVRSTEPILSWPGIGKLMG